MIGNQPDRQACFLPRRHFPFRFYLIPHFLLENLDLVLRDSHGCPHGLLFLWPGLRCRPRGFFLRGDPPQRPATRKRRRLKGTQRQAGGSWLPWPCPRAKSWYSSTLEGVGQSLRHGKRWRWMPIFSQGYVSGGKALRSSVSLWVIIQYGRQRKVGG